MNNLTIDYYETCYVNNISYFTLLFDRFVFQNHVMSILFRMTKGRFTHFYTKKIEKIKFERLHKQYFNKINLSKQDLKIDLSFFIDIGCIQQMSFNEVCILQTYITILNELWFRILENDSNIKVSLYSQLALCC